MPMSFRFAPVAVECHRHFLGILAQSGFFLAVLSTDVAPLAARGAERPSRPNIVFMLADDLGYGELGCYGQEKIRTPRIDELARGGMRFTQHYSGCAVCAPSRCVLMTGKHTGHSFIRDNLSTPPEGNWPIPTDTVTLVKLLQQSGYVTGGFGKWGLGGPGSTGMPTKQGINRWFGFYCQGKAHNHYPISLWDNDQPFPLDNPDFSTKQKFPADADPTKPENYARYSGTQFAPDLITEQALEFLRQNRSRPFFLYFPSTIPHLALQVPEDSLVPYAGKLDDSPYNGGRGYLPHIMPHAAYAAMVSRLDRHVGQLVDLVRELELEGNTIFVFTSDNGPAYDGDGGTDSDYFHSAAGLRGRKGSLYEGGFRVPLIVAWKGRIAAGSVSDRVSGFEDWLPTILELAGAAERIPADVDGISLLPTLLGSEQPPRPFLYREFPGYGGQQMARMGDWKGVRQHLLPQKKGDQPDLRIELYNLKEDPHEERNVAAEHPEIVARLGKLMKEQHTPSEVFPLAALDKE